ncbi:ribosome recycling factor [Patescibacteria group bacterium]|nr:ribosome recycling factor [Patescibacteria group bacterium]MBU1931608.1 ribosome recycling factor [Patescibacteria group bacterium]
MISEFQTKARQKLSQVLTLATEDLDSIKTGRAKPALIENIRVDGAYPGTTLELRELASISSSDSQQLIVKPWDQGILAAIEKAIAASNLGLNPVVDNDLIRIKIPPLTAERREELVKLVWQKIESSRILIRQVRSEIRDEINQQKGEAGVSEDDIHQWFEDLQQLTDDYIKKLEDLGKAKEAELKQI